MTLTHTVPMPGSKTPWQGQPVTGVSAQVQLPLAPRAGRTAGWASRVAVGLSALLVACLAPGLSGHATRGPGACPDPGRMRRPQPSWATCSGTGPFVAVSQKPHGTRNLHET